MSFLEGKMITVEEYVKLAEEAQQDGAHVAVLTYYGRAIEEMEHGKNGYGINTAEILLAAVQYAQRLKKERDRKAIARWSLEVVQRIQSTDLVAIITKEIAKLQLQGDKHATA